MKKILEFVLLIIVSLTLNGCGCSKKKDKEIITTCSLISDQSASGYKLETEYKIYSKKDIVTKIKSKTTIASEQEQVLKRFEEDYKKQYEKNKNTYGGYDYDLKINKDTLVLNLSIDYSKYDMNKFVEDNVAMKEYVDKDNKFTLEGAKKYYNSVGANCK